LNKQLVTLGQILVSAPRVAILEALLKSAGTVAQLSEITGHSTVSVRRHLERLEALGAVERVPPESGRTIFYRPLPRELLALADAVQGLCA